MNLYEKHMLDSIFMKFRVKNKVLKQTMKDVQANHRDSKLGLEKSKISFLIQTNCQNGRKNILDNFKNNNVAQHRK